MTDIRKGDLVRGTRKNGENSFEGRVTYEYFPDSKYVDLDGFSVYLPDYDVEVLERPIDEELLLGAINAWRGAMHYFGPTTASHVRLYRSAATAVFNFVNEYNANKESK